MAKLDFSSLKTADLRSVAPVDESAIPRAQQLPEGDAAVSASVPQIASAPIVQEATVPPPVTVSVPRVSVAPVQRSAPAAAHASKKISLTSLKTGGSSIVSRAPEAPATEVETVIAKQSAPKMPTVTVSLSSKRSATTISLGTKPAVSIPDPVAEEPLRQPEESPVENVDTEPAVEEGRALVEGVDIIQAAKVIGTEGESLANEILTESLKDPEAAKKEAEEKAVAAVVIPETEKVFFPNLEMDDDFFDDPLFEGIVPPKPDKKPEVRQPIEMKKEEAVAETVVAETAPQESVATAEETPSAKQEGASSEAPTEAATETDVPTEAVTDVPQQGGIEIETVAESGEPALETPAEAYVETVAKDLSAERKGGLSKLFGERKVLVRAMAGFFAVAVLGIGTFSFVSPSIKTSGPEAMNTGSELPKYVPTGETKVVGEGVRVFTGRRPNAHKNKKPLPVTNSGSVASSWAVSASGSAALPVSASGADVGSGSAASGTLLPEAPLATSGATETLTGSAEAPQPVDFPAPQADMPPAPMPN